VSDEKSWIDMTEKKLIEEIKFYNNLGINLVFAVAIIILDLFILFSLDFDWYCNNWGDKYTQSSYCFDPVYRCEVECGSYSLEYSGKSDGCSCICEGNETIKISDNLILTPQNKTYSVSVCSGFIYEEK
jgi:hypothetical protein